MARTIHCTVIEVPSMNHAFDSRTADGFRDLIPGADPYISALIEKLRADELAENAGRDAIDELPPPLGNDDPDDSWQNDWSSRGWPRQ